MVKADLGWPGVPLAGCVHTAQPEAKPRGPLVPTECLAHRGYQPEQGIGNEATVMPSIPWCPGLLGILSHPPCRWEAWGPLEAPCLVVPLRLTSPPALCWPWGGRVTKGKGQGLEADQVTSNPGSYHRVTLGKAVHPSEPPFPPSCSLSVNHGVVSADSSDDGHC